MITKLYLAVTADRYELPIAVADTVPELSRMTGRTPDVIYTACNRSLRRDNPENIVPKPHGMRFYRITYDSEDDVK